MPFDSSFKNRSSGDQLFVDKINKAAQYEFTRSAGKARYIYYGLTPAEALNVCFSPVGVCSYDLYYYKHIDRHIVLDTEKWFSV